MLDPFELAMQNASQKIANEFSIGSTAPSVTTPKPAEKRTAAEPQPVIPVFTAPTEPEHTEEATVIEEPSIPEIIEEPKDEPLSSEFISAPASTKSEPCVAVTAESETSEVIAEQTEAAAETKPAKTPRAGFRRFIGSIFALLSLPACLTISGGFLLALIAVIFAASALKKAKKGGLILTVGIISLLVSIGLGVLSNAFIANETFDSIASQVWNTIRFNGLPDQIASVVDFLEKIQTTTTDYIRQFTQMISSII